MERLEQRVPLGSLRVLMQGIDVHHVRFCALHTLGEIWAGLRASGWWGGKGVASAEV